MIQHPYDVSDMQILVLPHVHSDLCWPDIPEVCTDSYLEYIDDAISYSSRFKSYRFTMEHAMFLKEYIRRNPRKRNAVKQALEEGNLDCGAFYSGPTELTLGGEGLIRELYLGKMWLEDELGYSPKTAWNVDAPGHIGQLPQILVKAGVEFFFMWKTFFWEKNYGGYVEPYYFTWQSPDGTEITACSTPYGYGLGDLVHIREKYELFEASVQPYIEKIRDETVTFEIPPYILIAHSDGESERASVRPSENVARWNETHPGSPMKLVSSTEFAEMLKGKQLPVSSGEMPCWWDTVMSYETERVTADRYGEGRLLSAECAAVLASMMCSNYDIPRYDFEAAWEARLFACEHNEGGYQGNLSDSLKEYKVKAASHLSHRVGRLALRTIAGEVERPLNTGFVLFNPLSWKRRCEARLNFEFQHNDLPPIDPYTKELIYTDQSVRGIAIVDSAGSEIPAEIDLAYVGSDGALKKASVLLGIEMEGCEYRTFSIVERDELTPPVVRQNVNVIENEFFRIEMDPTCGALASIYDKSRQRELLDVSKYFGAELVTNEDLGHDETEEFTGKVWRMRDYPAAEISASTSPFRSVLRSKGEMIGCERTMEVSSSSGSDSIAIKVGIDWHGVRDLNMRIAFPFNLFVPAVNYGVPFGFVEYEQEHPDCTNIHPSIRGVRDWFDLSDRDFGVTVATEVIPVDFADRLEPESMQPLAQPMLIRSTYSCFDHIYRNNNRPVDKETDRNTPCQFNKGGSFEFHFVLHPHTGRVDPARAARQAWEMLHPPVSAYIEGDNITYGTPMRVIRKSVKTGGGSLASDCALLKSRSDAVIHTVTKAAERGEGIILRMHDASGEGGRIVFEFCKPIRQAFETDILENNIRELSFCANSLEVELTPFSIRTIRVIVD
ncbi:MAG: glycoside hydrolase family 38 N-terminal domain-containing protein [Armatimonadota bacterium]